MAYPGADQGFVFAQGRGKEARFERCESSQNEQIQRLLLY